MWKFVIASSLIGSGIALADLDNRFDPAGPGQHAEPYDFAAPSPQPLLPNDYQKLHRDVPVLQNPKNWSGTSFVACEFKVTDPKVGHPFHRIVLNKDQTKGTWLPSLEESIDGKTVWRVIPHAHVNINHLEKRFEIFEVAREHRETYSFNFELPTTANDTRCHATGMGFIDDRLNERRVFKAE